MANQQSLDFDEHARQVVEEASTAPWPLRDGRTVIPREVLVDLAEVAVAAPVTGREIDYTQTLRDCFDALLRLAAGVDVSSGGAMPGLWRRQG